MRKILLVLVVVFSFGALLQANAQKTQRVSVLINRQKVVVKNKLTIRFASLVEDSRCPTDVRCIQAGTARIAIEVGKNGGRTETFEVAVGRQTQTASFNGYDIELVDLNPKPASNIRIDRNGYTAIFQITPARRGR